MGLNFKELMMEFDDFGGGSASAIAVKDPSQWCGKHAPTKPGYCTLHEGVPLHELHDEEIERTYMVKAVFYCPKWGCDNFDWDTRASVAPKVGFCHIHLLLHTDANLTCGLELFRNAVLLKILFIKQCQMAEKLQLLQKEKNI